LAFRLLGLGFRRLTGLHFDAIKVNFPKDYRRRFFALAHLPAKFIDLPHGGPVGRGVTPHRIQPDIYPAIDLFGNEIARRADTAPWLVPRYGARFQLLDDPLGDDTVNIYGNFLSL
jgi:hypothetical protein